MLSWCICAGLGVAVILLIIKIKLMQRSMREISECIAQHLSEDTNQLISISSGDRHVRRLAADISQQLALLRRQRMQYLRGDRELKEAVTNISHDLRTPLTAICGYLELLEREEKSENCRRYLERISERTEALKALTEELFRYSVITAAGGLELEPTDLRRALEESLVSFFAEFRQKGIAPVLKMPEEPVIRELDCSALSRILGNIISNAVKYSAGDFSAELKADGELIFSNSAPELSQVDVGKLFDRFYTVDPTRRSSGLGLSIAKLLCERMQGSIRAEYEHGVLKMIVRF